MNHLEIAETIAQQLGGTRTLRIVIGATSFVALPADDKCRGGLRFRIPSNLSRPKVSHIQIKLNSLDYYDVEFHRVTSGETYKDVLVSAQTNVFCADLKGVIEQSTGLRLSIPRIRGLEARV